MESRTQIGVVVLAATALLGAAAPEQVPAPPSTAEPAAPAPPSTTEPAAPVAAPTSTAAPPASPGPPRFDHARVELGGSYFHGSEMLGRGTRAAYRGGAAEGRLEARWFFHPRLGYDFTLGYAFKGTSVEHRGTFRMALDLVAKRWGDASPGIFFLSAGGGMEFNGASWLDRDVRGYGTVGAHLIQRVRGLYVRADLRAVPITSDPVKLFAGELEAAFGFRWFEGGLRGSLTMGRGGDPEREYPQQQITFFVAGVARP